MVGLFALALVIVESFPLYALYEETTTAPKPTFNPLVFGLDLGLFVVADILALALFYLFIQR